MAAADQIQSLLVHSLGIYGNPGDAMVSQHPKFFLCDTVRPPCLHRKFQSILRIKQLIQLCQDRVNVLCRQSSWGSASKVDGIQRASLHLVCHIFHFLK